MATQRHNSAPTPIISVQTPSSRPNRCYAILQQHTYLPPNTTPCFQKTEHATTFYNPNHHLHNPQPNRTILPQLPKQEFFTQISHKKTPNHQQNPPPTTKPAQPPAPHPTNKTLYAHLPLTICSQSRYLLLKQLHRAHPTPARAPGIICLS